MPDALYKKFVKHWEEVTDVPPQTLGRFTPFYKEVTKRLKIMPWPALVGVSAILVIALYLVLGSAVTFVVSILQRGF